MSISITTFIGPALNLLLKIFPTRFLVRKYFNAKYQFDVYNIESQKSVKKIEELIHNPQRIDYATLTCPEWESAMKERNLAFLDMQKTIEKKKDDFRFVLKFLSAYGSVSSFQMSGIDANEIVKIFQNYVDLILKKRYHQSSELVNQTCIEIWKSVGKKEKKIPEACFKFYIDTSKKSPSEMLALRALMSDMSFLTHDERVQVVYPYILLVAGNLRAYPLSVANEVLFLNNYKLGLG